ncbi:FtsB family cell division protein [Ruixingdingia sedimenti]|uniref:Septum formation initiator family protein n=1 Tax=Ruixingdingia sedimenti TaxID=3073604 RepID=A0ABU1FC72_9RHOB|nr:septum formation initiator family protein [Xinfangfangia sp. LG-4]MDR5654513.1 septum formation initiator family protein [Xinfangfangia sp. LG-4]
MSRPAARPGYGAAIFFVLAFVLGSYFTFAAVQGDYGLFRRVQIMAEADTLEAEKTRLEAELARLSNLTTRLSDHGLDLDLLDEQARDVLGLIRADEVVIH